MSHPNPNDYPEIEGHAPGASLASRIMGSPAEASGTAPPGVMSVAKVEREEYRPTTVLELLADIPGRTSMPELAQVFMLTALQEFSMAVANAGEENDAEFDKVMAEMGKPIKGVNWRRIAFEINSIIVDHVEHINAQPGTQEPEDIAMTTQQRIDDYIAALIAHDWTQPLTPELQAQKESLDPTGAIHDKHKPQGDPAHIPV